MEGMLCRSGMQEQRPQSGHRESMKQSEMWQSACVAGSRLLLPCLLQTVPILVR